MNTKKWIGCVLAAGVALVCATCAPVEPPASKPNDPPAGTPHDEGVETLVQLPTPAPEPKGPRDRVAAAIDNVRRRDLLTSNGFWTIFHGILGLGPSVTLLDTETGKRVNAVDFICDGGELRGLDFYPTKHGLDVRMGQIGISQGHQDQFIAEMGQWGMPIDRKFVVLGRDYTFGDFVNHAKMRARINDKQELSWAIGLIAQYLGTDISWTNGHGESLHFDDLIRYELDASVENAACGGTHRLFGLTWAYHYHLQRGGAKTGVWKDVADKIAKYRDLAKGYQNPDGSLSTDFFRGPGNSTDKQLRINTTGHTLEWLALALTDDEMKEQWIQDAGNALAMMILDQQAQSIDSGPLYHATHGLLIYFARVHDPKSLGANAPFIPLPDRTIGQ